MLLGPSLGLSAILFSLGVAGVLLRRNAIMLFMCIELMLNAVNLAFVAFAQLLRRQRPGHRLLRDDGGGRGGGGGAGDHPGDVPPRAVGGPPEHQPAAGLMSSLSGMLGLARRLRLPARAASSSTARWPSGARRPRTRCLDRRDRRAARRIRGRRSASSSSCWRDPPQAPIIVKLWPWLPVGRLQVDLAFQVDQLSAVMLLVITGVGQSDPPVQHRLHEGRSGVRALLRVSQPLRRLHAGAGARLELPGDVHRLGRAWGSAPTC